MLNLSSIFRRYYFVGISLALILCFTVQNECKALGGSFFFSEKQEEQDAFVSSRVLPMYGENVDSDASDVIAELLPTSGQTPETLSHFPNRTAAFIWRNWNWVPLEDMAETLQVGSEKVCSYAEAMGLPPYQVPTWDRDSVYITVLRRNWSLLPYEQLLVLLHLTPEELAKRLREDDFLSVKLGAKPLCEQLRYEELNDDVLQALKIIADEATPVYASETYINGVARFEFLREFDDDGTSGGAFVSELDNAAHSHESSFELCYLHSYFALFGDPLLQDSARMFPNALLEKLAARGVNGVWLHSLLRDLASPTSDFPEFGEKSDVRRANLRDLVNRAKRYGISVYLYMNEPRAMPEAFFVNHEEERGVLERGYCAMCASSPKVKKWLSDALAELFASVPGLGGIFTISGSENLTSCVSHEKFAECPRCSKKTYAELLVELNAAMEEGVHRTAPDAKVIVWDWGWRGHGIATDVIERLPKNVWLQSVSEWGLPIERGGVSVKIGEYSISAVGPGPRAEAHWEAAKRAGLKTIAKCQFNTTWEIGSIPFVPALELVARHASNLTRAGLDGVMESWSLGGFPSVNLELVNEIAKNPNMSTDEVLDAMAVKYFGNDGARLARNGWRVVSDAFEEFPFSGSVVYTAPNQIGAANLLRLNPSGWRASMVGIPYDDVDSWRQPYPADVFASQMEKCGRGFIEGSELLRQASNFSPADRVEEAERQALYAEFAGTVFLSVANQVQFIQLRNERIELLKEKASGELLEEKALHLSEIEKRMIEIARDEISLARRALTATLKDSRIGFESTNQYWFAPGDLVEKIISCNDVIRRIEAGQ